MKKRGPVTKRYSAAAPLPSVGERGRERAVHDRRQARSDAARTHFPPARRRRPSPTSALGRPTLASPHRSRRRARCARPSSAEGARARPVSRCTTRTKPPPGSTEYSRASRYSPLTGQAGAARLKSRRNGRRDGKHPLRAIEWRPASRSICARRAADVTPQKQRETTRASRILRCVQRVGKAFSGMLLERFYNDWLAQASYLVACQETEAAIVVDPNRDVERYIDAADARASSRSSTSPKRTSTPTSSPARASWRGRPAPSCCCRAKAAGLAVQLRESDGARLVRHGDAIDVGHVHFEVRHTPGHTPEHICFRRHGPRGERAADRHVHRRFHFRRRRRTSRPARARRQRRRARWTRWRVSSFASIRATSDLPDYLQLWPGHGAGSACGKALGAMPSTTLGYERIANWAFQIDDEERVRRRGARRTAGAAEVLRDDEVGQSRRSAARADRRTSSASSTLAAFERAFDAGAPVVDVRRPRISPPATFPARSTSRSERRSRRGRARCCPYDRDIVLLADDPKRIERARHGLIARSDWIASSRGAAASCATEWRRTQRRAAEHVPRVDMRELAIDIRARSSTCAAPPNGTKDICRGAEHLFLGDLARNDARHAARHTDRRALPGRNARRRSRASLLQAQGFTDVANVAGRHAGVGRRPGLPIEASTVARGPHVSGSRRICTAIA